MGGAAGPCRGLTGGPPAAAVTVAAQSCARKARDEQGSRRKCGARYVAAIVVSRRHQKFTRVVNVMLRIAPAPVIWPKVGEPSTVDRPE